MVLWIMLGLVLVGGIVALVVSSSGDDDDADDNNASSDNGSSGGGSETSSEAPSGPEETVDAYIAAMQAGDCEAGVALVTESSWQEDEDSTTPEEAVADCQQEFAEGEMDEFEGLGPENTQLISQAVFGEDDAMATVTITPPGASEGTEPIAEIPLVDEGDGWRIDFSQIGGGSSSAGGSSDGGGEATSPEDFED